jgi:hypothetical protein
MYQRPESSMYASVQIDLSPRTATWSWHRRGRVVPCAQRELSSQGKRVLVRKTEKAVGDQPQTEGDCCPRRRALRVPWALAVPGPGPGPAARAALARRSRLPASLPAQIKFPNILSLSMPQLLVCHKAIFTC